MALTSDQMVTTKNFISNMSEDQLRDVINNANHLLECRADRRRKELWGNVVAALQKYVREVDDIEVDGTNILCIDPSYMDNPGMLYTCN